MTTAAGHVRAGAGVGVGGSGLVALAYALGASTELVAAVGIAAGLVVGLVPGLVAAGGIRGAVQLLWRGRGAGR